MLVVHIPLVSLQQMPPNIHPLGKLIKLLPTRQFTYNRNKHSVYQSKINQQMDIKEDRVYYQLLLIVLTYRMNSLLSCPASLEHFHVN
jgi:hypothetical protein